MSPLPGRRPKGTVDVASRAQALRRLLEVGGGRLDPDAAEAARRVLSRTDERLSLGLEHTVVAFAGATGSGKSSLFNAVAGADVSATGVLRPTTSKAAGLVVGDGGDALLDWLGVPRRHRIDPAVVPVAPATRKQDQPASLEGLVLLDLPDHDSTAVAHRLEVDRLVRLVDLLVWVVDPQKYADEALHAGYLQQMTEHASVMMLALNQADRLPPDQVQECLTDLRRLLAEDGLPQVPVLAVSARTGQGLDDLRARIGAAVVAHEVATARVMADLDAAVNSLRDGVGESELDPGSVPGRAALLDALAGAAGVPTVTGAARRSYLRQARRRTGWPLTRWVGALRRDPLRVLHVGRATGTRELEATPTLERTSLPAPSHAQRAQVALATRRIATDCSQGLPQRWVDAVREAAQPPGPDLADALDQAVARVRIDARKPLWWSVVGLAQLVLFATFLIGGLWLGGLAFLAYLQLPDPATPTYQVGNLAVPLPTVLAVGGFLAGPLLALLATPLVLLGGARRRRRTDKALRASVDMVAGTLVLAPVAQVLTDHRAARGALREASGRR